MIRSRHADHGGFTLIEIVVALAILGSCLVILLEIHFGAMDLFSSADRTTILRILTQSVVSDSERDVLAGNINGDGDFGRRYEGYGYHYEAAQVDPQNTPGLFEVQVTVTSPDDERKITYYMYDGQQSEEGGPGSATDGKQGGIVRKGESNRDGLTRKEPSPTSRRTSTEKSGGGP
ncbi:MAG: prepilin-type N-terminal cleavage/methylation domain-containing protein [Candidatus Hydrogenedentota bacterium]